MAEWIEIVVPTPVASAGGVAEHLVREVEHAAHGVQIRPGEIVFWVLAHERDDALARTSAAVSRLVDDGYDLDAAAVHAASALPEEEWRDAWKKYFHVTRLTRQLVVVPSWESYVPEADDVVLDLDPGRAFGTGAHASTHLVLEELQALADAGARVERLLDVGTGSGILAIAVAKLWPASSAIATDVDAMAIDAARENCEANGVGDRITCTTRSPGAMGEHFDLVCANIQAHVLYGLRDELAAALAPGGRLILSGILTAQIDDVAGHYCQLPELDLASVRRSDADPEWSSALLVRAP